MRALESKLGEPAAASAARVLARARRYVEHETPSRAAERIVALADVIEAELRACGAEVERHEAPGLGRNLVASVPGTEDQLAPVLVMAHIDTVHPIGTLAARPFRVQDGRAYGPGVYDMKGGLATVIEALATLHAGGRRPRRPVRLLVTCDEEIGSHSARALILSESREAAAVLVPEPCLPDGGAKTFRKGVATYRIETGGRAAHAGIEGSSAISAITELIHALERVLDLAAPERGTHINVGQIGGGSASNVVAGEAWATVDVRLAQPGEGERIHDALLAIAPRHPQARIAVTLTESRPPLLRSERVVALYQQARRVAAEFGVDYSEGASGGGSDGSIAADAGAATLDGLGPQGDGAHSADEHIIVDDLAFRLAFMTRLLETL
jgi:glutamate carboxypeptidase